MKEGVDISGKIINTGDIVAFGADNGSRLFVGKVYKLTPKKVWVTVDLSGEFIIPYCRDYDRVSIIEKRSK